MSPRIPKRTKVQSSCGTTHYPIGSQYLGKTEGRDGLEVMHLLERGRRCVSLPGILIAGAHRVLSLCLGCRSRGKLLRESIRSVIVQMLEGQAPWGRAIWTGRGGRIARGSLAGGNLASGATRLSAQGSLARSASGSNQYGCVAGVPQCSAPSRSCLPRRRRHLA